MRNKIAKQLRIRQQVNKAILLYRRPIPDGAKTWQPISKRGGK